VTDLKDQVERAAELLNGIRDHLEAQTRDQPDRAEKLAEDLTVPLTKLNEAIRNWGAHLSVATDKAQAESSTEAFRRALEDLQIAWQSFASAPSQSTPHVVQTDKHFSVSPPNGFLRISSATPSQIQRLSDTLKQRYGTGFDHWTGHGEVYSVQWALRPGAPTPSDVTRLAEELGIKVSVEGISA